MHYIAFDAHKRYTLASVEQTDGQLVRELQIPHERGALRHFLQRCDPGSPVAVETTGNWYWIVDEIEEAGCAPRLVHARKAKLMLGMINKQTSSTRAASTASSVRSRCPPSGSRPVASATGAICPGRGWSWSANAPG